MVLLYYPLKKIITSTFLIISYCIRYNTLNHKDMTKDVIFGKIVEVVLCIFYNTRQEINELFSLKFSV
ncbi:hypothetical protein DW244_09315 [Streptococcus pasteurianus]|nr:hypothetical protein DW244_09315 [Streptococcus pasteurianus]RGB96323.1 hypothetical protein DWV89_10805 [Streptococcus pasteurianus]